jgi:hypothetical protein
MGQRKFKKNSKNGKPAHGAMICDVLSRKNTKYGIPMFQRKTLHKKWHQAGVHSAFYPSDHDLCKFHSRFLSLDPIFSGDVHLSKSYNFYNKGFLTFHIENGFFIFLVAKRGKRGGFFVKGILRVENVTTPIFLGGGLCRNVRSNI